ncbi:MAG: hypothetical protein QOC69_345 [Mycobacterium sp.]|jgi:general stress protein 26|nr:hypothetical protein [Mycobacterium sp.]
MRFNDAARQLIEADPATLVTVNRDGSAQASLVWMNVVETVDGDDELVTAHLSESQKVRNIRRDPRVEAVFVSTATDSTSSVKVGLTKVDGRWLISSFDPT